MRLHITLVYALAKSSGRGYNKRVVQVNCCAEWGLHSVQGRWGALYTLTACRNYASTVYSNGFRLKMQEALSGMFTKKRPACKTGGALA